MKPKHILVLPSVTKGYKYELYVGDGEEVVRYGAESAQAIATALDRVPLIPVAGYANNLDQFYWEEWEQ